MVTILRMIVLALLFSAVGCSSATAPPDTSSDVAAIRAAIARATEINNQGDAAAWADIFAEGAIVMPEGEPEITGRLALEASAKRWFDHFNANITIEPVEIETSGDWAFVRTTVRGTLTPKAGGEQVAVNDKEIAIYRRQSDGTWKVWRLIGNSNSRRPQADTAADEAAIQKLYPAWVETTKSRDLEAFASFLAPGAYFQPPDGPALQSRQMAKGVAKAAKRRMEESPKHMELRVAVGDIEEGHWPTNQENTRIGRWVVEMWGGGNLSLVDELASPEYGYRAPGIDEVKGRETLKELMTVYHTAFPNRRTPKRIRSRQKSLAARPAGRTSPRWGHRAVTGASSLDSAPRCGGATRLVVKVNSRAF